jgi:hypothetical protein
VHLISIYLKNVYLTGVHLMGVYLMGVHLIGVYLMGIYLIDVYFRFSKIVVVLEIFDVALTSLSVLRQAGLRTSARGIRMFLAVSISNVSNVQLLERARPLLPT